MLTVLRHSGYATARAAADTAKLRNRRTLDFLSVLRYCFNSTFYVMGGNHGKG